MVSATAWACFGRMCAYRPSIIVTACPACLATE